jgi:hypothetical protein
LLHIVFPIEKINWPLWIFLILIAFGILLFYQSLRKSGRDRTLAIFIFCYVAIILIWPWPPYRFLIPILPFLIALMLNGFYFKVSVTKLRYVILLALLMLIWATIANISHTHSIINLQGKTGYPYSSHPAEPVSWSSYQESFEWIRNHTGSTDVIASGLDTMCYLYTGRKSFRPFAMNPTYLFYGLESTKITYEEQIDFINSYNPKYLLITPLPGFAEEKPFSENLNFILKIKPGFLNMVYKAADNRFKIYKVSP